MTDLLRGDNSGVRVDVRATDFTAGAETGVVYKSLVPDGDWTRYKPTDEWQRRYVPPSALGYDTNSCTDFSCLNSVEAQVTRMLQAGELPADTVAKMHSLGYFDAAGLVNYDDWFNAITAGTTAEVGNTLYATWDAVRKYGLVPQAAGRQVNDFTSAPQWFGARPSADQYALGLQFLTMFDVKYEWVSIGTLGQWDLVATHLQQAPLHVLVPTGATWDDPLVKVPTPTFQGVNHAVSIFSQQQGVSHTIVDHYNPFVKRLEWGYYVPYILKGVVTPKSASAPPGPFHYVFQSNMQYGAPASDEVHKLQEALQSLGFMKQGVFGPYGPQTKAALGVFQTSKGIQDPDGQGSNFGPRTRAAMNAALL